MIKIENTEIVGWKAAIRGMRNPMNSWEKSDSVFDIQPFYRMNDGAREYGYDILGKPTDSWACRDPSPFEGEYVGDKDVGYFLIYNAIIGPNDKDLMLRLNKGGPVEAKYRRMIIVYADITAPLYWWKEFDTYKVGTVANSCSTMHKIHAKEFELDDFSYDQLLNTGLSLFTEVNSLDRLFERDIQPIQFLNDYIIPALNLFREKFLETKDKRYWWQMIQLLPSSYNQRRTVMMNYEVLAGIYPKRKNHKLDEWHTFCGWIEGLPLSEIITGETKEE